MVSNLIKLTPRQLWILSLLWNGKNYKEISAITNISTHTVRHHMMKARRSNGIDSGNNFLLCKKAVEAGLI